MITDAEAPPSYELGALEEPSSPIIQLTAAKPPTVPEPSTKEAILLALRQLAESEPDAIAEDLELRSISKLYKVGMPALKASYPAIRSAYIDEKKVELAPQPTPMETAAQEQADAAQQAEQKQIAEVVEGLQQQEDLHSIFHDALIREGFICDELLSSTILLSHGARLLQKSSAFFFTGASGSGKTDGLNKGARFLPPESVQSLTSVSDQALYYIGDVGHDYLMFGEMSPRVDEQDDFRQMAMRQLISENQITRLVVEKADGKANVAVMKKTEGPCVIVATTTKEPNKFNDELQNRASWVQSNDSSEVTARVLAAIANSAENPVSATDPAHALKVKAFQEFHRTLRPLLVKVPFAHKIKPTSEHVTVRRLSNLILDYVRANALLHQHSRERETINGQELVIATEADYELSHQIATANAPRVLEPCSVPARKLFNEILEPAFRKAREEEENKPSLKTSDIVALSGEPGPTVGRWLRDLTGAGLLIECSTQGERMNRYMLPEGVVGQFTQDLGLVHPSQLQQPAVLTWADVL